MTGSHILDLLAHDSDTVPDEVADDEIGQLAARMVANSIDTVMILRDLRPRMFPGTADPKAITVARALRAEFEEWIRGAESLLAEASHLKRVGHSIPRLDELNDFCGLTQAMLTITLESHLKSLHEECKPWSIEEMRRELHLQRRE